MNVVSSTHVICLFPKSTFLYRRSFVARQEEVLSDYDEDGPKARLARYSMVNNRLTSIGMCHKKLSGVELGTRFVGDPQCWSISCIRKGSVSMLGFQADDYTEAIRTLDHSRISLRPSGQTFEVLDWSSYTSQPNAYLRIGEPAIWRWVSI